MTDLLPRTDQSTTPMPPCQPPRRDPLPFDYEYDYLNHRSIIIIPDELLMYHGHMPDKHSMPKIVVDQVLDVVAENFKEVNQPCLRWARKKRAENNRKRLFRRGY